QMLETTGHTVTVATEPQEALERFESGDFDAVFTDLGMPGMSGLQLAARLRALDPRVGCVLVTGWGSQVEPSDARAHGGDVLLAKPYRLRTINTALAL